MRRVGFAGRRLPPALATRHLAVNLYWRDSPRRVADASKRPYQNAFVICGSSFQSRFQIGTWLGTTKAPGPFFEQSLASPCARAVDWQLTRVPLSEIGVMPVLAAASSPSDVHYSFAIVVVLVT